MCVYLFAPSRGQPLCFSLWINNSATLGKTKSFQWKNFFWLIYFGNLFQGAVHVGFQAFIFASTLADYFNNQPEVAIREPDSFASSALERVAPLGRGDPTACPVARRFLFPFLIINRHITRHGILYGQCAEFPTNAVQPGRIAASQFAIERGLFRSGRIGLSGFKANCTWQLQIGCGKPRANYAIQLDPLMVSPLQGNSHF